MHLINKQNGPDLHSLLVVQSLSHAQLFATPGTATHQASLTFAISQGLLKLMSVELMMPLPWHLAFSLSLWRLQKGLSNGRDQPAPLQGPQVPSSLGWGWSLVLASTPFCLPDSQDSLTLRSLMWGLRWSSEPLRWLNSDSQQLSRRIKWDYLQVS